MDFKFPDVGEGITEGRLVKWHVNVGDSIKSEQTVASIETDKAVVDIPSPVTGVVSALSYNPGDTVFVGKTLMTINDGSSAGISNPAPISQPAKQEFKSAIPERIMPESTARYAQYSVSSFNSAPVSSYNGGGQTLAMPAVRRVAKMKRINLATIKGTGNHGQILLRDIGAGVSDVIKSSGSVEFQFSDSLPKIPRSPLASTTVQSASAYIASSPSISTASNSQSFNGKSYSDILATPATKQLARELGVDLTQVKGTGSNGSITRDDVLNASKGSNAATPIVQSFQPSPTISQSLQSPLAPASAAPSVAQSKPISISGEASIIPFTPVRNAIYKHMTESKNVVPHFTITDDVDVTDLFSFREKYKEHYEKQGIKLTYLPFIVKAVVDALIKHPYINARVNDAGKEIILKKYYNIGIATDTPDGLMVPVLKGADKKNILAIAAEIPLLSGKARDHKLSLDDMSDGTFTITSLGNSFGQSFTPIINYPEVAILGIGRIVDKPMVINGAIVARKVFTLSLSADHRIIDGAEASRFMNDVKWNIENFESLMMN